jgi:hypothetical protein
MRCRSEKERKIVICFQHFLILYLIYLKIEYFHTWELFLEMPFTRSRLNICGERTSARGLDRTNSLFSLSFSHALV